MVQQGEGTVPKPGESRITRNNVDRIPRVNVTQDDLYNSKFDPTSWLMYGNSYDAHHHSTADVVTPDNVGNLELEWAIEVGNTNDDFQGSPLIVPGDPPIMYQTNGPDQTRAIDARTGRVLWEHVYEPATNVKTEEPPASRGLAVLGDTVYRGTLDYGTLALDRYTADEQWYYNSAYEYRSTQASGDRQTSVFDELQFERRRGSSSSYPLHIYEGTIIQGSFGGEWGVSGWAQGLSLDGERQWHTNMTPPDQWVGDSWKHGGSTVWQAPAIDTDTGRAVIPTSNPGPWFGTVRPGWNPYSAGKVGLDMESGEVAWNYQEVPHDWWDYDSPSPPIIYEAEVDGEQRKLASWAGKTGWVFTVDMETGQLVQRSEEYVQHMNAFSLPQRDINDTPWMLPNLIGGTDPQPPAYDPEQGLIIVKGLNRPMKLSWEPVEYEAGTEYEGETYISATEGQSIEGWTEPPGNISAVDPVSGELEWRSSLDTPPWGGLLTTATGLTFGGIADGKLLALDTSNGQRLAEYTIGPGVDGNPVTWYDPGTEKQYVSVSAGGAKFGPNGNKVVTYSMQR